MWLSLLAFRLAFSFLSFESFSLRLDSFWFRFSTDNSRRETYCWSFLMLAMSMLRNYAISLFWKMLRTSMVWFMKLFRNMFWFSSLAYCRASCPRSRISSSCVRMVMFSFLSILTWSFSSLFSFTTLDIFRSSFGTHSSWFSILTLSWSLTGSGVS